MSYIYYFSGQFQFDRQLAPDHHAYLKRFAETRRMKRHMDKIVLLPDLVHEAVNLPVGPEGAYFVAGAGEHGDTRDDTVLDYNRAPIGQFSSMWCPWHPSDDGMNLVPENSFNDASGSFSPWLGYLIEHFLSPWVYILSGVVNVQGEEPTDFHILRL